MRDAVVIGAGLAGLAAAVKLAQEGQKVTLLTKGIGGLQLGQGTIDVIGYTPDRVTAPLDEAARVASANPAHPYAMIGTDRIAGDLAWLTATVGDDLLVGDGSRNYILPTAVGALRPTALAQPSMLAGEPAQGKKFVIVGLSRLKDMYSKLVADNLARQKAADGSQIVARSEELDFEIRPGEQDTSGVNHARAFDDPAVRARFIKALKPLVKKGETVGLPAVLGLNDHPAAWQDIQKGLGCDVFEIPLPPPSVPGMRLNQRLTHLARDLGVRIILGSKAVAFTAEGDRVTGVEYTSAGHHTVATAREFVLANGGFESGALAMDSHMVVRETLFGLPLAGTEGQLTHGDYWGDPQPLYQAGVVVDKEMRPLKDAAAGNDPVYQNLHAVGGQLAGATRWREKSGDGIALSSGLAAADSILGSK